MKTAINILLVSGSSGLIGSEVVSHFATAGWRVFGVDNNQRAKFFGPAGDTRWNQQRLAETFPSFAHIEMDIRDRAAVLNLVEELKPDADRPHGRPAEPRPGRISAVRRL